MGAPLIDLAGVQRRRDAEIAVGRRIVAERADDLAGKVLAWASRAERARSRLSHDDSEAAAAVEAWCRRRLKLDARRVLCRDVPDSVRADVAELCIAALAERLQIHPGPTTPAPDGQGKGRSAALASAGAEGGRA